MKQRLRLVVWAFSAGCLIAQNVGYVVDNQNGQVLVIDLATRTVKATIPAGPSAAEMFILPNNRYAYVSCQASSEVALLDLQTNQRVGLTPVQQGPGGLTATPDGRFLYVANDVSNDVSVIDAVRGRTMQPIDVGATPVQVNISPDGRFVYAVNQDEVPGTVSVIDTTRNRVVKTLTVGASPNQFAILPNLGTAYVVNSGSNDVTLVDLAANEVTGTIAVGQDPVSVAYSSDSRLLYVVNRGSNNISVVDTSQNRVVATIPAGSRPVAMVVTFDSKFGFVSNSGSNIVSLLDLTARTLELNIAVGTSPFSLMLDPDENYLYVTNTGSRSVSVIDVNTDRVVQTIQVGGVPVQFTMLNAPTLLELAPNPALVGSALVLNGEGFLPASTVRFTTTSPPRTFTQAAMFLDSQGLQATVPSFQGSSAVVDVLNADGNSSERITITAGTAAPKINSGGVVEAAGFALAPSPISGNAIVAVFGTFPGMLAQTAPDGVLPLPRVLGGTRVTFNGVAAPLFAAINAPGYSQINAIAPVWLLGRDKVRVAVTVAGQVSPIELVNVAPASPGIFLNAGNAIAVHGADQTQLVTPANPAKRGEVLVLYAAGLGDTALVVREGDPAPGDELSGTVSPVSVTVGGVLAAEVQFAGLTPTTAGLYQVNFVVPAGAPLGSDVEVALVIEGRISNKAKLAIQ